MVSHVVESGIIRPDRSPVGSNMIINVENFDGVTSFYRDALGLTVTSMSADPASPSMIFQLGPGSRIEFVGPPYPERLDRVPARGVEVMIGVDDAAAWRQRLIDTGVTIQRELMENPWGDRSFGIDDPSGQRIWIFEIL